MPAKTYKTFGDAVADPTSAISRFVGHSKRAMEFNPATLDEWTAYQTWQRSESLAGRSDFTTETWRKTLTSR